MQLIDRKILIKFGRIRMTKIIKLFSAITLLYFFLLTQFSCNRNPSQTINQETKLVSEVLNSKVSSDNSQQNKRDDDSAMFYGALIERICYNSEFREFSGTTIGYKRETIKPENIEILKSIGEVSPKTIDDFVERNLITKELIDGYDVKFDIEVINQKDSYENVLNFAHRKNKRIESIIGLSRIGFNEDQTQALAYFEFYGSDNKLRKNYVLMNWDYSHSGSMVKNVKMFSVE